MAVTAEELALLGLSPGDDLPEGGQGLDVTVCCGTGTARTWTDVLEPLLATRYRIHLEPGSFNLWAEFDVEWLEPAKEWAGNRKWELCPIILEEKAVGVAFRANRDAPRFLEVLSPVRLRIRLGAARDGDRIRVRFLPGSALGAAV